MSTLTLTRKEASRILRDRDRKTRQAKAKAARPKSVKADRGRVRDTGFLAFIRRQTCIASHLGGCCGAIEATHIRFADAARGKPLTGLQTKPDDRWCLPACSEHHRQQHAEGNERRWWSKVGLDPLTAAERFYAIYQSGSVVPRGERENHGS